MKSSNNNNRTAWSLIVETLTSTAKIDRAHKTTCQTIHSEQQQLDSWPKFPLESRVGIIHRVLLVHFRDRVARSAENRNSAHFLGIGRRIERDIFDCNFWGSACWGVSRTRSCCWRLARHRAFAWVFLNEHQTLERHMIMQLQRENAASYPVICIDKAKEQPERSQNDVKLTKFPISNTLQRQALTMSTKYARGAHCWCCVSEQFMAGSDQTTV